MSFDPFNDFKTAGYLRNFEAEKGLDLVKILEQAQKLLSVCGVPGPFQDYFRRSS